MTLDSAIHNATLFYSLIGAKTKKVKSGKIKVVMRITAYRKELNEWDVAVFFESKYRKNGGEPDCFLSDFIEKYEVINGVKKK